MIIFINKYIWIILHEKKYYFDENEFTDKAEI